MEFNVKISTVKVNVNSIRRTCIHVDFFHKFLFRFGNKFCSWPRSSIYGRKTLQWVFDKLGHAACDVMPHWQRQNLSVVRGAASD